MTLEQIKQALLACFSGEVFTAPDTLFGSGTLKAVFDRSLPNGQLAIAGAALSETAQAVVVAGQGQGPFAGMAVSAVFTPQGDDVALVATGTSSGGWSVAGAFPALASSILAELTVPTGALLVLRTLSDDQHPAGLGFQGQVGVDGPLAQAIQFLGKSTSLTFAGPITYSFGAPAFILTAPVSAPFSLGPLQDLGLNITLNSVAAPLADPAGGTYGATGAVAATAAVAVVINGQTTKLPASLVFTGAPLVDLTLGAPSASGVSLTDLAKFALGGDLDGLMPPKALYDVAGALTLDAIDFTIAPLTPALVSVAFDLSSPKPWPIGSQFAVTGVTMSLFVNVSPNNSLSGAISGALQIGKDGSICTLDATASLPDGTFSAQLDPTGAKPNISDLITYLAGDFGLPAIEVSALQLALTPSSSTYSLSAGFSTDWTLPIGDFSLAVTGASIDLADTKGTATGSVSGTLVLNETDKFDLSYAVPGGFKLFAQVPSLSLSTLVAALCKAVGAPPPGFDFSFEDATILITKNGDQFDFTFGAQLDAYGSASVVVQRGTSGWGYAFGVLLNTAKLDALPGLGLLSVFDKAFGLQEIVVVSGTLAQSSFSFPALSSFNNPSIKAPKVSTPGWNGDLVAGLNIYAMLDPAKSEALGWLCKLVGFKGQIAASLQVPTDPTTGTTFAATLSGPVNSAMSLSGAFVAKLVGGNLDLGLVGSIPTTIAGHAVTFAIEVDFQANGVFVSGSTKDTITFEVVQLGGLAIELGVDGEGVPSIGVAATIQVSDFDSSIAIFFDSALPSQSLFAGAISDITLDQAMGPIVGLAAGALPAPIKALLAQVALKGIESFTLPSSLAQALDARNAGPVITAFAAAGVTINSNAQNISILGDSKAGAWAVTDLASLTHYHLSAGSNSIAGEKEVQVKFVPQTTQLGNLPPVQAGYAMSGELDVFGLTGIVDIDIQPSTGLSIEAYLSPVHFLNDKLLSITAANNPTKGAYLSLCTYEKNSVQPHATATGQVELLGLVGQSVDISISSSGATFDLSSTNLVYSYALATTLDKSGFTASGSASVGFDHSLDLGPLGSVSLDVTVGGTVKISLTGQAATAGFSGAFTFQSQTFNTGQVSLDVTQASLENLADELVSAITDAVKAFLLQDLNPAQWLNWVKQNIIPNVAQDAQQVGQVLGATYHQTADEIASATKTVLGYSADAAATALRAANFTADAAAKALGAAGYAADQIASAIKSIFNTHADTSVHIDTPSGPHIDTDKAHIDTPAGPHVDTATPPHGDTHAHVDTPRGPHVDTGGNHVDSHQDVWGVGPHEDTHLPHVDTATPPHGDTAPHVDTPAGPHVDTHTPPHVDTPSVHIDTATPPHGDTSTHIDVKA